MIRLSPDAAANVSERLEWIARNSGVERALDIQDRIVAPLTPLSTFPLMDRAGRVPGTRELKIRRLPYLAVYQPQPDHILVLRVLHGAMQWPGGSD